MTVEATADRPLQLVSLAVEPLTENLFRPFGQIIIASPDGKLFDVDDAQLEFQGTPRFYILSLKWREPRFRSITRHLKVTQCLASVDAKPWLLAVAPPAGASDSRAALDPSTIKAFHVPSGVAVKLHRGAWHAGPYFKDPRQDFFNLELSDTNQTDHSSCQLDEQFGLEFTFASALWSSA